MRTGRRSVLKSSVAQRNYMYGLATGVPGMAWDPVITIRTGGSHLY